MKFTMTAKAKKCLLKVVENLSILRQYQREFALKKEQKISI